MNILSKLFGRGDKPRTVRTTASAPFRIAKPVAGFLCLAPDLEPLMEADKAALGGLFHEAHASATEIIPCHVLFLYCKVNPDGGLSGVAMRVRDFIKACGACIAIVAAENDGRHYVEALKSKNDWPANIVLVVDRRGQVFAGFFRKLFEAMKEGRSMLSAWVELAPQSPDRAHSECPVSLMIAEAGHIALNGSS